MEEYKQRKEKQTAKQRKKQLEWKQKHKMIVEDSWGMMRWLTQYIEENRFEWERRRERERETPSEEYERYTKMDEIEMIEIMKDYEMKEKERMETKIEKAQRRI